ncbi:transcription antitermination protein NusB [Candidatus Woesebacteria bacterium]|nr:transcription antitermination protein NusB [Candidatus Woesebacteria bacterium]
MNDEDSMGHVDPRHKQRTKLVQQLYSYSFDPKFIYKLNRVSELQFEHVVQNIPKIDMLIVSHAPKYPIDQIAKADLAILRLAIYELAIEKKEPPKVIINEAVELAKEMGSDRSFAFVNAVLGAIVSETKV